MINDKIDYKVLPRMSKRLNDTIVIEVAEKIMNDYFYETSSLDSFYMEKGYTKWDYIHENSLNTYQLYIHSLNVITYLVDAYLLNSNTDYLKKAYDILLSWDKYNKTFCKNKKRFAWVDHSACSRVFNILYLYLVSKNIIEINDNIINEMILENIDYLDKYLYTNDNHGIMLDKVLISVSFFLNDQNLREKLFNKAYYRLREAFFRDFSKKAVHLENSTDYHSFTKKLYIEVNDFLKNFDQSLGEDIEYYLKNDNYYSYIVEPNYNLPMIGDSGTIMLKNLEKNKDNYFDVDAGIYIIQDEKIWLSFICGYSKINHKHFDDLSINLFYNGEELFVDSGKYNYDRESDIRKYIVSTAAHNTISIGENYNLVLDYEFDKKPYISSFYTNNKYDLVVGNNTNYENGSHKRYVVYVKNSSVIVYDMLNFDNQKDIIQTFNVNPFLKTIKKNNSILIKNNKNKIIAKVEQKLNVDEFIVEKGDESIPKGIISPKFAQIQVIDQIKTKITNNKASFLTLISLENNNPITDLRIDKESNCLMFMIKKESFKIFL